LRDVSKKSYVPRQQDAFLLWHDTLKAGVTIGTPGVVSVDLDTLAADNAALHIKLTAATLANNASTPPMRI
jgi:hypothetical protein